MWRSTSILIGIVFILLALGIVMLYSTSGVLSQEKFGDPHFFLKRQAAWMVIGLILCYGAANLNYQQWHRFAVGLAVASTFLLTLVFVPGIGLKINGSYRWVRFGSFIRFQPSELAKFAIVVLLAWWMARVQHKAEDLKQGLIFPCLFLGLMAGLIFVESDFGTTLLVAMAGLMILYVGGTRFLYLLAVSVSGIAFFIVEVSRDPERMNRIISFTDPVKYADSGGYQIIMAIYAFVVGGPTGVGLGQSLQKHFYLPEAHTDFIYAIIGEELGLVASLGVALLYLVLFFCGVRISFAAPDRFGKLLGLGITFMLTLQAAINICVVTGSLPPKGLPLPFISFGGSSMMVSLLMLGVLINIALKGRGGAHAATSAMIKDREHDM